MVEVLNFFVYHCVPKIFIKRGGAFVKINIKTNKPYKRIAQYDLKGNLIKEWNSFLEIYLEKGYREGYIRKSMRGLLVSAYGYKWEFKYGD